jgi:hypothetical protein
MITSDKIDQETTAIFLHIHKTAGTTLHRIIERQYPPEEIHFLQGDDGHAAIEEFKALSEEQRASIRMLKGHMAFGLHAWIPGPSTYFTILRDPIERVISDYYFILREPNHYLYDIVASENLGLQTFLERQIPVMLNDAQVRMISGVWGGPGFGECDRDTLELAKKNLCEHFAVVGITEKFDETLFLLKETFDWQNSIEYQHHNVTQNRPKKSDLGRETLRTIKEANQLDIELYAYAEKLFRTQIRRRGLLFGLRLKAFQLHNLFDRSVVPLYWQFRKVSIRTFIKKWWYRTPGVSEPHKE